LSRRVLLAVLSCAALSSSGLAAVVLTSGHDSASPAAAPRSEAERFLALTGDSPTTSAAPESIGDVQAAAAGKAAGDSCLKDPETVGTLPNGWCLRPAGHSVDVLRFPLGVIPTSNGKVVVTSNSGGLQGLTVVDQKSLATSQTTAANLFVGLAETKDGRVYAAGGNANRVFRYRWAGDGLQSQDLTENATFPNHNATDGIVGRTPIGSQNAPAVDGIRVTTYPGAMLPYGDLVLTAGTLSEPSDGACPSGRAVCGRVNVIDTRTDAVVGRAAVGMDPYALALDPARKRVYVANWADEAGRGAGVGTVSVVDLTNPAKPSEIAFAKVGHHPSAVLLSADRTRLFVANTNDDSISVLDVTGVPRVIATETVRPVEGVPVGAHPDALALAPDGKTLFVALAGINAVEVRDGRTGARVAGHPVYIPTAWYPSALAITGDAKHYRLWVTNAKGTGPSMGYNGSVLANGTATNGTLTAVDLPVPAATANRWTETVVSNDNLNDASVNPCQPGRGVRISQVLCPPKGQSSPIKHVVYVVTENKTFDQYFGDLPTSDNGWRADPTYVLYGQQNTPNHHKLATSYSLGDNFFSDAEVSVTGHSWTSGAVATDHNEKTWEADYDEGIRGSHGNGDPLKGSLGGAQGKAIQTAEDELDDPEGGYIFEAFKRAGATPPTDRPGRLSMGIYGESTALESGNMDVYKAPGWKDGDISYSDTCRVLTFRDGQAPDGPSPAFSAGSAPAGIASDDCNGRKLATQFTLKHWTEVYKKTGRDIMPSFIYMSLPQNHTLATTVGNPTPQSMVADNDYALGMLIDSLSRSPFWRSTAVMQTEDDTQVSGDHVSALRDYLHVASPWAKPGPNHQWGSMPALLRTIEQIFGVRPISLFDRLAAPMHEAFLPSLSARPNLAPYTAVKAQIPFDVNQPGAVGAELSARLDFSTYDLVNEQLLNAILYAAIRHRPLQIPKD
jgi:DNA-binding beta-propeller fold protein YncE